jgi:integrase/recombinase XerD
MTTSTLMLPVSDEQDLASWAAVAFVASYASPGTRQAYATQLRLWFDWCEKHHLEPLADVRRPHVELYARGLEARGLAAATVALKLVVLTGFYRYCVEEQLLEHSPAVHVRRPKVSQESTRLGLDRTELGAFLVQAGLSGGNDHALACLLALNALRVSEACGAELSDLALANGHRVVRVVGKGNQAALIPLAPRTMRAIDSAVGERTNGPLLARSDGSRLEARCWTDRAPARKTCRDRQGDLPALAATVPAAHSTAAHSTATPPTSSPPTSPEPPAHADNCSRHGCRVPTPRGSRDCRAGRRGPQAVQSDPV